MVRIHQSDVHGAFFGAPVDLDTAAALPRCQRRCAVGSAELATRTHQFHVAFDGADFDEFLARAGITRDDFLTRVRDVRLTVRYLGFRGVARGMRSKRPPSLRDALECYAFALEARRALDRAGRAP